MNQVCLPPIQCRLLGTRFTPCFLIFMENVLLGCNRILKSARYIICTLQTQTLYSLQGNPCEPIPTGKSLFSLQGTPVFITGSLFSLQGFPCKPLYFPVRDCSVQKPFYLIVLNFIYIYEHIHI